MRQTLTVIVPAYNEQDGITETLDSIMAQTELPEHVIVVDDFSDDDTHGVAYRYGLDREHAHVGFSVITPDCNLGSKARAQNFALEQVTTDLVLPLDADTVLAPDYLSLIKDPFADPRTAIAAGCVLTKSTHKPPERGRMVEYLYGFHYYRPIQNATNSPIVCSGCCSAFRTRELTEFGGFPERTVVEDMDYTWSKQIEGRRAVYVGKAEAFAADPESFHFLNKQMKRWERGFFQNVRIHFRGLRHKPMLMLWVMMAVWEILVAPLWWTAPVSWPLLFHTTFESTMIWWLAIETGLTVPVLVYAAVRRHYSLAQLAISIPFVYANKLVNFWNAWRAMWVELAFVPLGWKKTLAVYEKGR